MLFRSKSHPGRNFCTLFFLLIGFTLSLTTFGCSGGGASNSTVPNNPNPSASQSSVQVRIGDAPSDSILSFELNISKIDLVPQTGTPVTVLSTPAEIELTHLSGTLQTLALANVPNDTYTGANVSITKVEVTYIPSSSTTPVHKEFALNSTVNVTFSPALTVGIGASIVNFDLNLAQSLTFDASGNVTGIAPVFAVTTTTATSGNPDSEDEDHGRWDNTVGRVTSVAAANGSTLASFVLTLGRSGQSQTFTVDSSTQFSNGISQFGDIKTGMLLKVNAATQTDGSLLARQVQLLEASEGSELEGIITSTTGTPVTSLDLLVHDEAGTMATSNLGTMMTVDVSNAVFMSPLHGLDDHRNVLANLPFSPVFDNTHIAKGQNVEADIDGQITAGNPISANRVQLRQQTIVGVAITPQTGSTSGFTLVLDADSAFAKLTGATSIDVYQVAQSQIRNSAAVTAGNRLKIRGFLFYNDGKYSLVASQLDRP